jgi:WD40 repeat protein/energy-coupling factor transporter ATP-binding protein EcfA2
MSAAFVSKDRPFPGLRPFEFEDHEFFFGRDDQIAALYRLLDRNRFIAVVGSSGSGKSSLVKAGLLPLLQRESEEGGRKWRRITLHPGDAPMVELENAVVALAAREVNDEESDRVIRSQRIGFALRRSSFGLANALDEIPGVEDKAILVLVDQFEEIFRYSGDEAIKFVQLLLEASRDRSHSIHVLITMRSDFIGDCARFYDLPEAVSAAQFLVPSLTRDQRDESVRQPITKAAHAAIESTLVERLLNDAGSENDQLPVLQHCLSRLWDVAAPSKPGETRRLTQDHYERIGKISGALSQHADEIMRSPELNGLELAVEQTFRALSKVDEEGRAVRRARLYSQLVDESGLPQPDMRKVVNRFRRDDCSFIVPSASSVPELQNDTRVDIVHEALLRKWKKISPPQDQSLGAPAGWLFAEAEDGRFYRGLLAIIERNAHATLSAAQYKDATDMWTGRPDEFGHPRAPKTKVWADRYGAGGYERVGQLLENSRQKLANDERTAQQAASAKRSGRVAAVASLVALLAIAMVIGAFNLVNRANAAEKTANDKEWLANHIAEKLKQDKGQLAVLLRKVKKSNGALLTANGKLASAKASAIGSMHVAMQQTGVALQQTGVAQNERAKSFVEAGRRALLNSQSDDAALYLGAAYVLDPNDRDLRVLLPQALDKISMRQGTVVADRNAAVTAVQFDPARGTNEIATAGADGSVRLWDGAGHLLYKPMQDYDANDRITGLAFDPTGRYLATVAEDGSGRLHSLGSGGTGRAVALGNGAAAHTGRVNAVRFSHGGTYLATAGADGKVIVWRSATGSRVASRSVDAYVNDVVFTPDDGTLIGALADGRLLIWDWKGGQSPLLAAISNTHLLHVAVNQSGTLLAAGGADGTVALYDLRRRKVIGSRNDSHAEVTAISFVPGDRVIASSSTQAYVLDAATGNIAATLGAQFGSPNVLDAVANPAGTQIATTYDNGAIALWAIDGKQIASFGVGQKTAVTAASFSPDGALLATAGNDGRMSLWRPGVALSRARASHHGSVESIAFNASGTKMLTGSRDGTAVLWNAGGVLSEEATLRHSNSDWVVTSEFSGDGQRALTVGGGALRVWNVAGNDPSLTLTIRPTMRGKRFTDAAFVPNRGVLAIQTGADSLAAAPYKSNRWFMWSLGGKRIVSEDPTSWATAPRRIQIANDGKHAMLFAADSASINIFDLNTGKSLSSSSGITAAALAHGSHRYAYAAGADNGTISFFPLKGDRFFRRPFTGQGHVTAMAFSGDDRWLSFAHSDDPTIKIWDMSGGKLRALLLEHPGWGEVASIAFAPRDAAYVLTLSKDGSAELWDRDTGELLGAVRPPGGTASAVFTPDGRDVVLGSFDGGVYVWRLATALTPQMAANRILTQSDLSNPEANTLIDQAIQVLRGQARIIR